MIIMAGDAFSGGTHPRLRMRAMALDAAVFDWHENVGAFGAATRHLMTGIAIDSLHRHMFGVIEVG